MFLLGRRLPLSRRRAVALFATALVALNLLSPPSGVAACGASQPPVIGDAKPAISVYDFTVNDLDHNPFPLSKYRGHVLIVVNVASNCGFTDRHYRELSQLYEKYAESKGLRILAFPSDQFGQEPGTDADIKRFVEGRSVKFDVLSKVYVNGPEAAPLFKFLKQEQGGMLVDEILWNYTKFIVDKNGQPVARHGPLNNPLLMQEELVKYFDQ